MRVYLDNSATTRPYSEVAELVCGMIRDNFGNPSSLHRLGISAEKSVSAARETISGLLGVQSKELYFTSGGTESNNIALMGYAAANRARGKVIVSTKAEHPSVLEALSALSERGFEIRLAGVLPDGTLDLEDFRSLLTEDTILVSVMAVNNETGAIQPIDKLRGITDGVCPAAKLHTDCVQAFGKIPLPLKSWGVDMASISAHKIHALKGCGALYVANKTIIHPICFGGHQEKNLRSGTENVIGIAAFGRAAQIICAKRSETAAKIQALKERLISGISEIPDISINGNGVGSPILNISFGGIKSEVILHTLEDKGIFVSSGSACASNKPSRSATLTAMGLSAERIDSAVRFSLSGETTEEEIDYCAEVLCREIPLLYRYMRKK